MERGYIVIEKEFNGIPILETHYDQDKTKLEPSDLNFNRIVIHHSGSRDYSIGDLIDLHVKKLKMGAIGYHFVIDKTGDIFYVRDIAHKGAHAYPNSGKLGIAFLSSFDKREPNEAEKNSLKRFLSAINPLSQIPVMGHNQDQAVELLKKYEFLKGIQEMRDIIVPRSNEDFANAKRVLLDACPSREVEHDILKLKTCPGIGAYQGMMQDVN